MIVDAVITWVDGGDVAHQQKINQYLNDTQKSQSIGFKTRYAQVDEIKYCVHSIIKYASFVRNIYIVTDNQIPEFYKTKKEGEYNNVFIVNHQSVFRKREKYLPVFNSRAIETELYKIPNLSEHFLYFNDDMLLINNVKISDFFIEGLPVIRGDWKKYKKNIFYKRIAKKIFPQKNNKKPSHIRAQEKSAKILGFSKFYKYNHLPSSLRKSTLETYFKKNKKVEKRNLKYKFRHRKQFLVQGLANHIEIKNNTCVLKSEKQMVYIQNYKKSLFWLQFKLNFISRKNNKLFLCLQSLDQASEEKLEFIMDWLKNKYQ